MKYRIVSEKIISGSSLDYAYRLEERCLFFWKTVFVSVGTISHFGIKIDRLRAVASSLEEIIALRDYCLGKKFFSYKGETIFKTASIHLIPTYFIIVGSKSPYSFRDIRWYDKWCITLEEAKHYIDCLHPKIERTILNV